MSYLLTALGAFATLLLGKIVTDLVSKEIQGRLDHVCFLLLRIARRRIPVDLRQTLHDEEWAPELHHILSRNQERPISRILQGIRYATSLIVSARCIRKEFKRRSESSLRWAASLLLLRVTLWILTAFLNKLPPSNGF